MTRGRRCRRAAQATLLGWVAGFVITSPVQIVQLLRNTGSDFQLLISALGYGFAVWLLITLSGAVIVWVCAALPVALFVREGWLLRHRAAFIAASICICVVAVAYKVHVWTYFDHDGIALMNFWIYACFAVVFAGIGARYYLHFLARDAVR